MREVILLIFLKFVMANVRAVLVTNGDMPLSNNIVRLSDDRMINLLSEDVDLFSAAQPLY